MAMDRQARDACILWLVIIPLLCIYPLAMLVLVFRLGLFALFWALGMVHDG